MKYHMAFNGDGAQRRRRADGPRRSRSASGFNWISHTCDHADLDGQPTTSRWPSSRQHQRRRPFGLKPFSAANLVNPGYSGLNTPERDAGDVRRRHPLRRRRHVGAGYDNPSPNAGIYNPLQPQILMIPRRPTNLFYNVSTPDQWMAEYNDIYRSFWGRDLSYDEILDNESDVLAQYLLKGENDPWMFHQPDLRVYGSGRSLLGDLLDQTFTKYAARVTTPLISPTDGRARAARRRSHAVQRRRRLGHRRSQRQHRHRARRERGHGARHRRLRREQRALRGPADLVGDSAGGRLRRHCRCRAAPGSGGGGTGGTTGTGGTAARRHRRQAGRDHRRGRHDRYGSAHGTPAAARSSRFRATRSAWWRARSAPGQSASALTTAELTGTTDMWTNYVEVFPSSRIVCNYACRAGTSASASPRLALDVNYRGPSMSDA